MMKKPRSISTNNRFTLYILSVMAIASVYGGAVYTSFHTGEKQMIDIVYAKALNTKELADEILYHNDKYFNDDAEITDAEYDVLVKELKSRDPEHPVLAEVGADPSYGKKVAHDDIMGSLEKITYDDDEGNLTELLEWCDRYGHEDGITVTPKIDGLAVRIVYSDGKLVLAATRGNGEIGQDVTDNVKAIESIPNTIVLKQYVEIRGEIYMKKSTFDTLRADMIAHGEDAPANPRNMASGTLNQKDPEETAKRPLHFYAYDVRGIDDWALTEIGSAGHFKDMIPELEYVPTEYLDSKSETKKTIKEWEEKRSELDYQIDGLVFSANSFETQKRYGYKGKCPVAKIAFKFRPEQKSSTLVDIVWQLGRTGKLTPVAQIDPVEIAGTVVDSPTLHNYAQIRAKDICIGDELLIEKAGEIIPQVVRVTKKEIEDDRDDKSLINYPEICPVCHEATELDEREVSVWCKNPTCPGQAEFRIIHFLKTIEVDGVGPGIVKTLIENDLVEKIPDLFTLDYGRVAALPGLGRSSARNILSAIADKKKVDLAVFLDSLGIDGLGTTTSKVIARKYKNLDAVLDAKREDLERLEGIGPITALSIFQGLRKLGGMIEELQDVGVEVDDIKTVTGGLSGKSFCITGTLSVGRKDMAALIERHGGIIKSSVSKGLDYLVAGDKTGKSKTDKALKYGTEVIDEVTVRSMMES
jgi:DNA ligase (NAD+)